VPEVDIPRNGHPQGRVLASLSGDGAP